MNWDEIQSKRSLIDELKRSVKGVRLEIVLVGLIVYQKSMTAIDIK